MIAVDCNGADGGPAVVAEGARRSGERALLFGPAAELAGYDDVVDAPVRISADEEPVRGVRSKPEASIVQAAKAVAEGRADALVSAGSTGPTMAAATLSVKRIRGVHRPALAIVLPVPDGPVVLLDVGANTEVRPEHLVQFAYMGAAFVEAVTGEARPSVGLLSVGEEPGKGTPDVLAARERLEGGPLNFAGNVEGFDIPSAGVRVVVTDGFTGNVALKVMEGTSKAVGEGIRGAIRSGPVSTAGGPPDPARGRAAAGRARPRAGGGRDPPRAAQARRRGPRLVRAGRHRQRGLHGPARGGRAHGRAHRRGAPDGRSDAIRTRW